MGSMAPYGYRPFNLAGEKGNSLRIEPEEAKVVQAALDIIPTTQHILDNYDALTTEEKNRLWKLVLRKVTAYRTPDGKLSVHIYPKLPKAI